MSMGNSSGGAFSSIIKTIFLLLGIYVVVINVTLWATSHNVGGELSDTFEKYNIFASYHSTRMKDYGYVGFESFYNVLGTFPGLAHTQMMTSTWLDIVSGYNLTDVGIFNFVLAIVRIFSAPILLTISIVVDILSNVMWLLGFLNIIPNTPQGTFLG